MRSAWLHAARQAAIETTAVIVGVLFVLLVLGVGGAIALYVLAGCTSGPCT